MKFKLGDATDSAHCTALKHEFLRCEEAFRDFETYGTVMIVKAQAEAEGRLSLTPHERRFIAYKTYNSYSSFIHHLYEFMLGAVARETGNSRKLEADDADTSMSFLHQIGIGTVRNLPPLPTKSTITP